MQFVESFFFFHWCKVGLPLPVIHWSQSCFSELTELILPRSRPYVRTFGPVTYMEVLPGEPVREWAGGQKGKTKKGEGTMTSKALERAALGLWGGSLECKFHLLTLSLLRVRKLDFHTPPWILVTDQRATQETSSPVLLSVWSMSKAAQ